MDTVTPDSVAVAKQILRLFDAIAEIKGRLDVMEEQQVGHESRLEDLERWQDETDDRLDAEL